jgi:hypothetical protein
MKDTYGRRKMEGGWEAWGEEVIGEGWGKEPEGEGKSGLT